MGRPLKIAKAQAVITITATDATTEVVTTSNNFTTLGIIAGMPFVTATSSGGLTAGTTYYILNVVSSGSNSTFTVSATPLNANPTYTKVNLSATTGTSIATTVGLIGTGFNNPTGSANTYGVVGGNTALYGKQTLTAVAFGQNGTGTIYSSDGDANVFGVGTDFANTVAIGSAIQIPTANINGSTDYVQLGFVDTVTGIANIEISNATATGDFLTTVGNAQTLVEDQPVVLTANIGGLTAGTIYYVGTIANAAAFSVSLTPGGANVDLTNQNAESYAVQDSVILTANASANTSGSDFIFATAEAGYIVRQKGKTKYLVKGGTTGLVGQCITTNVANTALLPNTMSILSTNAASGTNYVKSLNDYQTEVFPATVAAGSLSAGTAYTIYSAGTTDWTAVGAYASMTGITFTATGTGTGTGTAVLANVNPDVIATFNTAYAANTYGGQPNPIVTIASA
jgi:hypothetical protein